MSSKSPGGPSLAVTRHVDDLYPDLESKFDAGEDVRSLLAHPGWSHVTRILEAEVALIDRSLDGMTNPLPYPEMCLKHGRRGGLLAAVEAADAIVTVADRELDRQRAKHEGAAEPVPVGS